MTKLCNTCEYLKFCARSGIEDVGCDRYKKDTTTNEEWLKSCDTEQLAEFLADKCNEVADFILHEADEHGEDFDQDEYWYRQDAFVEWLKQPHTQ